MTASTYLYICDLYTYIFVILHTYTSIYPDFFDYVCMSLCKVHICISISVSIRSRSLSLSLCLSLAPRPHKRSFLCIAQAHP